MGKGKGDTMILLDWKTCGCAMESLLDSSSSWAHWTIRTFARGNVFLVDFYFTTFYWLSSVTETAGGTARIDHRIQLLGTLNVGLAVSGKVSTVSAPTKSIMVLCCTADSALGGLCANLGWKYEYLVDTSMPATLPCSLPLVSQSGRPDWAWCRDKRSQIRAREPCLVLGCTEVKFFMYKMLIL